MASIIKVDTIQKPDGTAPSASDLGIDVGSNILSVYEDVYTGLLTINNDSFVTANLSITLTPKTASSKFLLLAQGGTDTTDNDRRIRLSIFRNDTNLAAGASAQNAFCYLHTLSQRMLVNFNIMHIDSPNTTSPITYDVRAACGNNQNHQVRVRGDTARCNFIILELAG